MCVLLILSGLTFIRSLLHFYLCSYRFGKANYDEFSILAPLRQCCLVRESTFTKLSKLYLGPERLSELLDESLRSDPVYPVLTRGHLNAVDRRVIHILRTIARCVERSNTYSNVIIKDKF